jgi:hypothetical protein
VNTTHLSAGEIDAIREAIGFRTAGEIDGLTKRQTDALASAQAKLLDDLPENTVLIPFTPAELGVLWNALRNGAEGVLQPTSGYSPGRKKSFRSAANRIWKAAGFSSPHF